MIWCTHPWERDVSITGTNHGREHTQKSLQPTITLQEKIEITVMDIRLIYILSHLYIFAGILFCFWVFQ